jgi:hypothetical protein
VKYGISREVYDAKCDSQDGCCAICGISRSEITLHLDHDHYSKALRAFLCVRCNQGLGNFLDSPELLEIAASYIRAYADNPPPKGKV